MIYLDNAATSFPKAPGVADAVQECLARSGACPGRGGYGMARHAGAIVEETRRLLASLFNVGAAERIVFTLNATDALNRAIKGVLDDGDHVITSVIEHNSVSRPLYALERDGRICVTRLAPCAEGRLDPAEIHRALTPRTKLVAMLHASNVTGALQPVEAVGRILRDAGAWLLVDASQTAGVIPLNMEGMGIDLLAFPGHKGLLGPPGTGGLAVGPRVRIRPWREGGTGIFSEQPEQPEAWPWRLEAGSPNTAGIAGLRESVRYLLGRGVASIGEQEMRLTQRLIDGIYDDDWFVLHGPRTSQERTAVVSISVRGVSPQLVGERLDRDFEIAVRTGLHCAPGAHRELGTFPEGTIRISPGCFTSEDDIDGCLRALREVAADDVGQESQTHASIRV